MIGGAAPVWARAGRASRRAARVRGRARTKRARRPRGRPRRRSWNSSAAPVHAGSVPAGARAVSGPWSPAGWSSTQRVQSPPRRRARTCAWAWLPRVQRRPMRSKRRGAASAPVVRQPPPDGVAMGSPSASSNMEGAPRASAGAGRRMPTAVVAAPSSSAWRRVSRGRATRVGTRVGAERTAVGSRSGAPAAWAVTAQHDVVGAAVVAEPRGHRADEPLELGVGERVARAAAVADRVVVVLATRVGGLKAGRAVDVDTVDEPQRGEHLERAIDAGQAGRTAVGRAQPIVDLLGAETALLALQEAEDLLAGAAGPVPGASQLAAGVLTPAGCVRCAGVRHGGDRSVQRCE